MVNITAFFYEIKLKSLYKSHYLPNFLRFATMFAACAMNSQVLALLKKLTNFLINFLISKNTTQKLHLKIVK